MKPVFYLALSSLRELLIFTERSFMDQGKPLEGEMQVGNGTIFGFIPHRLEIPGHPELSCFPFNILFMSFTIKDAVPTSGTAIYQPDFQSFKQDKNVISMIYRNTYGGNDWVAISFDRTEGKYVGEKYVNSALAFSAFGLDWQSFFIHLTLLGLKNGERCLFEAVPERPRGE